MKNTAKLNSAGFTIIELIFSTLIFSLVMTVILVAAFQIGRIYYKGVSISATNEAARTVIEDIGNDVRFAQWADTKDGFFCVGQHRYSYTLFKKVTNDDISNNRLTGIRQDVIRAGCPDLSTSGSDVKQLLGPDMQLNDITLVCGNDACLIHVHVIFYGVDNKVFSTTTPSFINNTNDPGYNADKAPDASCSGNLQSSQFCAAVDLQTKVLKRI